jgi:hypothetical protein
MSSAVTGFGDTGAAGVAHATNIKHTTPRVTAEA